MSLIVNVGANIRGLVGGLNQGLSRVRNWVSSVNRATGGIMTGLIGAVSVAGAVRGVSSLLGKLDDIAKAAARLNVTTDEFQAMRYAADISGVSVEQLGKATQLLSARLGEALTLGGAAGRSFRALGLDLDAMAALPVYERLIRVADALKGVQDQATRSFILRDLFGRSGQEIGPTLSQLGALKTEFEALGVTIQSSTLQAAERLTDSITRLKTSALSFVAQSGLVEYLERYATTIEDLLRLKSQLEASGGQPGTERVSFGRRFAEAFGEGFQDTDVFGGFIRRAVIAAMAAAATPSVRLTGAAPTEAERGTFAEQTGRRRQEQQAALLAGPTAQFRAELEAQLLALEQEAAAERKLQAAQAERIASALAGLRQQAQIEQLRRAGLEEEAYIQEGLDRLRRDGRELTREQQLEARETLAQLFSLSQRDQAEADRAPRMDTADRRTNELTRMGAILGGRVQFDPVPRQQLDAQKRMAAHLASIDRKTENGGERTFP